MTDEEWNCWEGVYQSEQEGERSWFEVSLDVIAETGAGKDATLAEGLGISFQITRKA